MVLPKFLAVGEYGGVINVLGSSNRDDDSVDSIFQDVVNNQMLNPDMVIKVYEIKTYRRRL